MISYYLYIEYIVKLRVWINFHLARSRTYNRAAVALICDGKIINLPEISFALYVVRYTRIG